MKPHVLLIGLDTTLFTGEKRGDFLKRLEQYSKHVKRIDAIMYTPNRNYEPVRHGKITVYPTNSASRLTFVADVLRCSKLFMRDSKPTLIVTQDPFLTGYAGLLLKRKYGVPLSVNIYSSIFNSSYYKKEQWYNPLLHSLAVYVVKRADGIRVECKTEADVLVKLGISRKRIAIAPVPVQLQKFVSAKPLPQYRGLAVILAAGRLSSEKDFATLIRAAKIVEQRGAKARFLLIGGGSQEKKLKELAKQLRLSNFTFVGRVAHDQIHSYFKSASMYVLSSIYEGVPLVSVEASAAGLPVISTAIRDAPDVMIHGKTGIIVPIGDAKAMAHAIIRLLSDPAEARAMGLRGQKFVKQRYNPKKNLADLMLHWRKVSA